MHISEFDYELPEELIAQEPLLPEAPPDNTPALARTAPDRQIEAKYLPFIETVNLLIHSTMAKKGQLY